MNETGKQFSFIRAALSNLRARQKPNSYQLTQ